MTFGAEHLSYWQRLARPLPASHLGRTLVLSPHPDDESLGCGGVMAVLQQLQIPVQVIMISDGSQSHPNSKRYPAPRLRELRESETQNALQELGMTPGQVTFLRLPDGNVPGEDAHPLFKEAVGRLADLLESFDPDTVLVPWRRDPHPDHRATYKLLQAALNRWPGQPTVLEYPVWLWELGTPAESPQPGEVQPVAVDITAVNEQKKRAIAAHVSQVTQLIDDDPQAFWLRPDLQIYFEGNAELFFKPL